MEYDTNTMGERYYIMVDKDNCSGIKRELVNEMKEDKKDWTISSPAQVIRKGDYYILPVSEQATQDIRHRYKQYTIWCSDP
ncbi:hypothetical protein A9239_13315 [Methanosarcina sp. A14]|uniref:Uncharacterized protein n=3 Tax=Methanosarcina barkeri TaxID=2208 RepID=A0A0G3CGS7_METBA|nr:MULTISPECIES: UPF0228 family protein [Methanosarcina]AKJ39965.1 hypothetical protein MCM1_2969 [Methanosarcina barkeri CM1]OED04132.1 hypothetical protein A9239_13315 [Methanosarcina sp. A14]